MIKRLYMYYFTGTGNALCAARWIGAVGEKLGIDVSIHAIIVGEHPPLPEVKEGDSAEDILIGFLYPTHGFFTAPAAFHFIRRLPRLSGANFFLLNTRAGIKFFRFVTPGLSGLALIAPALMLLWKGLRFRGALPLDMPSNWLSVHPPLPRSWAMYIAGKCEKRASAFAEKLITGKSDRWRMLRDLPQDILISPIAVLYFFFGRFGLAKTFVYTKNCDGCAICADTCPAKAIRMLHGRPFWTWHCESCMRCLNICPKRAVQSSHLYFIILIGLTYLPFSETVMASHVFSLMPQWLRDGIGSFISLTYPILVFFVIYRLVHPLLRFAPYELIIRFTSLTNYWGRYLAPNINRKDLRGSKTLK